MRNSRLNLKQEVLQNAERFEFFEAARLLHVISKTSAPEELKIKFRSAATKTFPTGEIQKLTQNPDQVELYTNVIGLFGPTGVLPHQDKDLVCGGEPNLLLRDFLDIFNSRIIRLFYEAWKTNRQDVLLEMYQRKIDKREDACTLMLLSVCGVGLPQTRNQHRFPDDVFASSAGLLARNVRSASAIQRCVAGQFNVPVLVKEFIQERLFLPRKIQTRLSVSDGHNALGKTAIVGESVPVHRQRFEVQLGPLSRSEFVSLCPFDKPPDGDKIVGPNVAFRRLVDLIKSILGRPLDFDIRFQVEPDAVSPAQLGRFNPDSAAGSRDQPGTTLGFDSWVTSKPSIEFRDDTVKRYAWDMT